MSTNCNKLVNFNELQQVCKNQACHNLSFANLLQLVETTCCKPADNKFCQSACEGLLTTCNRVVNKLLQVMQMHPNNGFLTTRLLQNANTSVETWALYM